MSKPSKQSNVHARALVSPMFAWTSAVLTSGDMMLDAMRAAVRNARSVRVAVLPEADAPARKAAPPRKAKAKAKPRAKAPARRAKAKRRR